MSVFHNRIFSSGPFITINVAPNNQQIEFLKSKGLKVPKAQKVAALIDTGASHTVLDESIIQKLGLHPIDEIRAKTVSCEDVVCKRYKATFFFSDNFCIETSHLVGSSTKNQNFQCLIGRDILKHCVFTYDGISNQTILCF